MQLAPDLYLEAEFYPMGGDLRRLYDEVVSAPQATGGGMIPLAYAFSPEQYNFLTASPERFFKKEIVDHLIEALQVWGRDRLGASHATTPQIRVYLKGCSRGLLQDGVTASWHYVLSLTQNNGRAGGVIKVLTGDTGGRAAGRVSVGRAFRWQLEFNDLLVHSASNAYAIETRKATVNPLEAVVFLDGYLW